MPLNLNAIEPKEGKTFEPMDEGFYYLRVTNGIEKDEPGKPIQHELELTVQVGPYAGRKFKHWFTATEKMVPYIKHFYLVLGAKDCGNLNPADFVGKSFAADVIVDEYNGKKNNKLSLGCYYEWDGKEETATGEKPEKKKTSGAATSAPKAEVKASPAATGGKPAAKKAGPFSNASDKKDDEPPF